MKIPAHGDVRFAQVGISILLTTFSCRELPMKSLPGELLLRSRFCVGFAGPIQSPVHVKPFDSRDCGVADMDNVAP